MAREQLHSAIVKGRRIEAAPRTPTLISWLHKSVAEEQELVAAHTLLAEAQFAVLRMQHCIQFQQVTADSWPPYVANFKSCDLWPRCSVVQRPVYDRGGQAGAMRRVFGC